MSLSPGAATGRHRERKRGQFDLRQQIISEMAGQIVMPTPGIPTLKLIHQQISNRGHERPIFLICVFRDEYLLLEYFVEYYRRLGVTHFIMVDNRSRDEGPEYLRSLENLDMTLYEADDNYEQAAMGTDWVNELLRRHCVGQYCFTVDVDELFVFDTRKFSSLHDLIEDMEVAGANAIPVTLLDMYPRKTNNRYQKGAPFLAHSQYFDDLNAVHYEDRGGVYQTFAYKTGGVRQRVFGAEVCINKFPFFKFDFQPLGLAPGYHFFQLQGKVILQSENIRLSRHHSVLLHFKFLKPQLEQLFESRVKESKGEVLESDQSRIAASHWANENERYSELFGRRGKVKFHDRRFSRKMRKISDLSSFFA